MIKYLLLSHIHIPYYVNLFIICFLITNLPGFIGLCKFCPKSGFHNFLQKSHEFHVIMNVNDICIYSTTMCSSINECLNKWMINVYFSHQTTHYEKPHNVKNFRMVHFYHELPCIL